MPADQTQSDQRLTAAVIDTQTTSRLALPLLLPSIRFTGVYETTDQFLAAAPSAAVVAMDLHLDGLGHRPTHQRFESVSAVAQAGYRVCIYTSERTNVVLVAALVAGAHGVVHKAEPMHDLESALRHVAAGETVITPALGGLAEMAERQHLIPRLTPRQHQILAARARGEKFDSIARRLFISKKVAEEHWAAVASKFGDFLHQHSPADLERLLGLDPGDLLDWYP
jgi:DNA-binding NarL/FixJ family response regulator